MLLMPLPKIFRPFQCNDIIRLGKDNDGGYLVNKQDVLKSSRLISLGIDNDISFEADFVKYNDCRVDSYDDKVKPPFDSFFTGKRSVHNAYIGQSGTPLANLIDKSEQNVFLKCDIEGGEYDILDDLIEYTDVFSGLVIEFHEINDFTYFNELTNFMCKIKQKLIHVHVNNNSFIIQDEKHYLPMVVELTFTSSDNISYDKYIDLPHALDMPNTTERDEFKIVF